MASLRLNHIVAAALVLCARCSAQGMEEMEKVGESTIGEMPDTFTVPQSEFTAGTTSCSTEMAGCTGTFVNGATHQVEGEITVVDDCTFEISGWQFDGIGPAVEWWAAMQDDQENLFPYPANAIKIGELGAQGNYQTGSLHGGDSEVVVRLGKDAAGTQLLLSPEFNHISLWCEEVAVDFGNAALTCPTDTATTATPATPATPSDDDPAEVGEGDEAAEGATEASAASQGLPLAAAAAAAAAALTALLA